MSDGFNVDLGEMDGYSSKLSGDTKLAAEVSGLVAQSDVGDQSWGIVGIFVKSKYTSMLGDLNSLLGDMEEGLAAGAQKMSECARDYREMEDTIAKIFSGIEKGN